MKTTVIDVPATIHWFMRKAPRRRMFIVLAFLGFLGLLIYSGTFHASFHLDDIAQIEKNSEIRNINAINRIWDYSKSRFIVFLTFAVNYGLGGYQVWGYHGVNLAIHILSALIVYLLVNLLLRCPAMRGRYPDPWETLISLSAALIFLVHPVQTQAVTYVVQRMVIMMALFYLAAVYFYIKARLTANPFHYLLAWLVTIAAMFIKENAFTIPLAIVMTDIFFFGLGKDQIKGRILYWLPFLSAMVIVPVLMTYEYNKPMMTGGLMPAETAGISRPAYVLTQINVIRTYLRLLFMPVHQNLDYDYAISKTLLMPENILSGILLLSLMAAAAWLFKKQRLISFAIFWFFLTLSTESSIIPIQEVIFEHRLYLTMLAYCLVVPALFYVFFDNMKTYLLAFLMLALIFSGMTYARNRVWQTEMSLWSDCAKKSPYKARPLNNLGVAYLTTGDINHAVEYLGKAVKINPQYAEAYYNLGVIARRQGNIDKEKTYCERAIRADPKYLPAYSNLGAIYGAQGNYQKAIELFQKATEVTSGKYATTFDNLGVTYVKTGDILNAVKNFNKALEVNPYYAGSHYNLAMIFYDQKEFHKAVTHLKRAIDIDPGYVDARFLLGRIYLEVENRQGLAVQIEMLRRLGHADLAQQLEASGTGAIKMYEFSSADLENAANEKDEEKKKQMEITEMIRRTEQVKAANGVKARQKFKI